MKNVINRKMTRPAVGLLVLALCVSTFTTPVMAQRPVVVTQHHHYHPPRMNDFDRTLAIIGTVGTILNARHQRVCHHPVVVAPAPPVIVERQVIVERPVPVVRGPEGTFSPNLGAWFRIENMQIPGHRFTAARLMSDPLPNSPLNRLGLRQGDVITRLNDNPVTTLAELERHSRNTTVRYIHTGTTRVLVDNIFIPPSAGGRVHRP